MHEFERLLQRPQKCFNDVYKTVLSGYEKDREKQRMREVGRVDKGVKTILGWTAGSWVKFSKDGEHRETQRKLCAQKNCSQTCECHFL